MPESTIEQEKEFWQRLIQQVKVAVEQGLLDTEDYNVLVGERGISVGGDVSGSVFITGDNVQISLPAGWPTQQSEKSVQVGEAAVAYWEWLQARRSPAAARAPYRGLEAFAPEDADLFYGRDADLATLQSHLEAADLVWLYGPSGAGKTSLIQAGLVPALLEDDVLPLYVNAMTTDPLQSLMQEILAGRQPPGPETSLAVFLTEIATAVQMPLLIVFDQFESYLRQASEESMATVARKLSDCLRHGGYSLRILIALRADAFGHTLPLREQWRGWETAEQLLAPLGPEVAVEAIIRPAAQQGVHYEDGLPSRMVADLAAEVIAPQLQLVCHQLWQSRAADAQTIRHADYEAKGGAAGILGHHLDQVLDDWPDEIWAQAARRMVATLVTSEGERRRQPVVDWYADDQLRLLALRHHLSEKELLENSPDPATLRHLALEQYIERVAPHVTIDGTTLKDIVTPQSEVITETFVQRLQRNFVDKVVRRLVDHRVLHVARGPEGVRAYELVHDYLAVELHARRDDSERATRQLTEMLTQAEREYRQTGLLPDAQTLTVINEKRKEASLQLSDSARRLLLLAGAATEQWHPWFTLAGEQAVAWLREACLDEEQKLAVRRGAAARLGTLNDLGTFMLLNEAGPVESEDPLTLLADYLHHASEWPPLSAKVRRQLAWPLTQRRLAETVPLRKRIRPIVTGTAALLAWGWVIPLVDVWYGRLFLGLVGMFLFAGTGLLFAEGTLIAALTTRRRSLPVQIIVVTVTGFLVGVPLFMLMGASSTGAPVAALLAITLGTVARGGESWQWRLVQGGLVLSGSLAVAIFVARLSDHDHAYLNSGMATIFTAVFIGYTAFAANRILLYRDEDTAA